MTASYWAYGVSEAGSDRTTWHVRDTATGQDSARHHRPEP